MKAILLARVSDKKQDSNKAQLIRVNDYIRFKDLTVIKTHEIEESSTRGDRKKFQEVIKEIKQSKECIALVVDTVDRLQRSFRESVLLDDLRKAGKLEIHFYRENLVIHKNSNSADLLRWDMAVMFARSYILQLSDNVKRKLDEKRNKGEWVGKAPIGYKNIGEERNKDIIVDPEKAPLIRKVFELYATGSHSVKTLSRVMSQKGLRGGHGKPLIPGVIYKILNNPFYYGEMRSCSIIYPHRYETIISKDLFAACQRVQKGWHKKKFQYAAKPFCFRGLLHCAKCGCTMSPEIKKNKYVYYSCTNARKAICNRKVFVREERLLQPVYDVLAACGTIEEDTINEIVDLVKATNERDSSFYTDAVKTLQSEHDGLQLKQNRLTDLLLDGTIEKEAFEQKLKEFKDRQQEIRQQIEEHSHKDENVHVTAATVLRLAKNAYSLLQSSEVLEKRALLNFALQNPTVNGKNLEFAMASPFHTIYDIATHSLGRGAVDTFRTLEWEKIRADLDNYTEQVAKLKGDLPDITC
jgi:site-specific DNA recombinase